MESKKKKIEKLIKQYNEPTINNKDEILDKMIKLNSYISFQDKLNSIFSIIDKHVINEYEKTIVDYKCDENNITEESKNLILRNLRKIVLEEDKAKKEEAEVKRLLPYAICLASYDYIDKKVVKKQSFFCG